MLERRAAARPEWARPPLLPQPTWPDAQRITMYEIAAASGGLLNLPVRSGHAASLPRTNRTRRVPPPY
jgi:hypothetical protein